MAFSLEFPHPPEGVLLPGVPPPHPLPLSRGGDLPQEPLTPLGEFPGEPQPLLGGELSTLSSRGVLPPLGV